MVVFDIWGPYCPIFGAGLDFETALESTHVVEHLLFSIVPSIQTFDFDLILGSSFTFYLST